MSFLVEEIPEDDINKYGLREINARLDVLSFSAGWVVDRERNIYLRWIRYDREDPSKWTFTFFWKGTLLELEIISDSIGDAANDGAAAGSDAEATLWRLACPPLELPPEVAPHRDEFLQDLRNALTAFGSFGLTDSPEQHTATFDF